MAALSKFIENYNCSNDLIHTNSCLLNAAYNLYRFNLSSIKYFLPIIFMPLLLKIKKLNRKKVIDTFKYYAESIYCGTATCWTILVMICVIRQAHGKFGQYSSFFVPSLFGAVATFCTATPRVRRLFFTATIQGNIASLILKRRNALTRLLADSLTMKTLTFMSCSAIILHAKRHKQFRGFWFLQPNALSSTREQLEEQQPKFGEQASQAEDKEASPASNAFCTHESRSCYKHFAVGVYNYTLIGMSLDVVKMLISNVPTGPQGFFSLVAAKLSTLSLRSTAFLGTYIGIYRFTHCYLNQKTQSNQELNHMLASFLGGASFLLYPQLTLQSLGIVVSMEVLWKIFKAYETEQRFRWLDQLKHIPAAHIIYFFSLGQLVDTLVMNPKKVNSFGTILINGLTDNYARRITLNIERKYKGLSQYLFSGVLVKGFLFTGTMVSPSKLYIDPLCRVHCSQAILHPGEGCLKFLLRNIHRQGISSAKYFLPLLIGPLFSKWKTMDRELLLSAVKFYMQTVGCATVSAIFFISQICVLRNLLGRFYKHTAISIPGFSGMLICWFFPKRVTKLYLIATSQAAIEVMIRHRSNFLTRLICDSKTIQTLLFMVNSALILHYKRLKIYKGFWFIKPNDLSDNLKNKDVHHLEEQVKISDSSNCSHIGQTCLSFLLSGLKSYLLIGISLDLIKMLLRDKVTGSSKGFFNTILAKFRNLKLHNFKMSAFFASYIGIYRLVHCLLHKFFNVKSNHHCSHFASAFLGGTAYMFLDQLTIYTLSLVLTIQILWQRLCSQPQSEKSEEYSILEVLKRIQFARILVPFNISYLVHNYLYRGHLVNSLARNFINGVTDSRPRQILENLTTSDMEKILRTAALHTKTITF